MKIRQNFSLRQSNTFGIEASAERYTTVQSVEELLQVIQAEEGPYHILGGGSNILLTGNLPGLVIKNEMDGIEVVREDEYATHVGAGGGVVWHDLVLWCIGKNLGGIENLSLIPGSVGAAPIQNIGAYGVELKDVFDHLEAIELLTGELRIFQATDCRFGYRDSVFKNELKGRFFISKVFLKLTKSHRLLTDYGDIQRTLSEMGIAHPGIRDVSDAVIRIRQSKLPDPAKLGNAGSFFKNPEISSSQFEKLKTQFPNIVHFNLPDGRVKVPAGWLIEQAGWKGRRFGDAGCHERQALVLVNFGQAGGQEILELAKKIQASVEEKFGIQLTPEVNIW